MEYAKDSKCCKAPAEVSFHSGFNDAGFFVINCKKCGANITSKTLFFQSPESARQSQDEAPIVRRELIEKWNKEYAI